MQDIVQSSHPGAFEASAEMKHLNFPKFPKAEDVESYLQRSISIHSFTPMFL